MKNRQVVIATLIVASIAAVFGVVKYIKISSAIAAQSSHQQPPSAVTSLVVTEEYWSDTISAVGSLSSVRGTTLSAEESGEVVKINFESGSPVNAGDCLVELDTSVEQASLDGAKARADLAKLTQNRLLSLKATNATSKADLDSAEAELRSAQAEVASLQATIVRKRIVAPFAGIAGIRMVNVGQYVSAGSAVVPLHSLDPLYVNFTLPQRVVSQVAVGQKVELRVDSLTLEVFAGAVSAIDPQIDPSTRNFKVQATIANDRMLLRPGMFVEVSLILPSGRQVIAVPTSSINYAPYGDTVYVIDNMEGPDKAAYRGVRQQVVTVGARKGNQIAILSGLKVGDEIVTSGGFKLNPGMPVMVNNNFAPPNNPDPQPEDT